MIGVRRGLPAALGSHGPARPTSLRRSDSRRRGWARTARQARPSRVPCTLLGLRRPGCVAHNLHPHPRASSRRTVGPFLCTRRQGLPQGGEEAGGLRKQPQLPLGRDSAGAGTQTGGDVCAGPRGGESSSGRRGGKARRPRRTHAGRGGACEHQGLQLRPEPAVQGLEVGPGLEPPPAGRRGREMLPRGRGAPTVPSARPLGQPGWRKG